MQEEKSAVYTVILGVCLLLCLLFISFDKRLAQYLWDESDHARTPVRATHEQIARDTGAVRETVTRMLRHFADDGVVSLGRGTVTVTDAQKLRSLAGM